MAMTFDEYVDEMVRKNMLDSEVRAGIRREQRLGASAHRTSRSAAAMKNAAVAIHPAVYYGGKVK